MSLSDDAQNRIWPPYLADDAVQEALGIAKDVAIWNAERIYGVEIHTNDPGHMAVTAFTVVHEHQRACCQLTYSGLLGSAMALMRPSFEAFVRGLWLQWADDSELHRFQQGEDSLNLEKAIKLIVARSGETRYSDMLAIWQESKKTLHNYVHHSYQSLIRRSGEFDVPPEEVVSLLNFSSSMAVYASIEITELMERGSTEERKEATFAITRTLQWELVRFLSMMELVEPEKT
ncbi:hypothetical protein DGN21_10540 [Xanthomonas sp. MLO165]|uniref:DUF6988 family protein n=1 Tax=Xanthomonas sp. MLO165 TaxID=2081477 RepID=UPI001C05B124|nr:hypothetical protein [Xanthomonas sp. MLO165]QWM99701.1 hypothetical protein DGN21_10540 [Xanthomonas sp. MLO165]